MRWMVMLALCGALFAGCGSGGPDKDDLGKVAAPLVTAHEALKAYRDKVDAGMTFGEASAQWTDTAAAVVRGRRLYSEHPAPASWSEVDRAQMAAFDSAFGPALAQWAQWVDMVRNRIAVGSTEQPKLQAQYQNVLAAMLALETARASALTPGDK